MGAKRKRTGTKPVQKNDPALKWWMQPLAGNVFTIASAVVLQFSIILLPLVGPAGSAAPHATKNWLAWHAVLLTALILGGAAFYSKVQRRRIDGSRIPVMAPVLLGISLFLLVSQAAGWLRI